MMFERLQKKWRVGPLRLLFVLITFAIGGSLTGLLGRMIMPFTGIDSPWLYVPVYILVVTIIWPAMVLLVSIPLGQFNFFRGYLRMLGKRVGVIRKKKNAIRRIAIFASGAGSNAARIIEYFSQSEEVSVAMICCNKEGAGVINIAKDNDILLLMIEKERFFRGDAYLPELQKNNIDLIVLAGFLWKIPEKLIHAFPRHIINIHPALLPKFGGKGFYGVHVHKAVLEQGEAESGITIHYVDEEYDNGDIILQVRCPVQPGDTPETLAERIHQLEHANYPVVIGNLLMSDNLRIPKR